MRSVWSVLVMLVLLAPIGDVGITVAPVDAEIVAFPRGPAAALAKRVDLDRPIALVVAPVVLVVRQPVRHTRPQPIALSIVASDRHPPAGPRDPPA